MATLYGIDTDRPVTPIIVREALVECFYEAHCEDTGFESPDEDSNRAYCTALVRKAFSDTGGDFEHPTKDDLMRASEYLVQFSVNFRDPSIVQAHMKEIQGLLEKVQ